MRPNTTTVVLTVLDERKQTRPHGDGPRDCCCQKSVRVRNADVSLSILGAIGWLALPKCPLCLAAYFAIISGLSISARYGRVIYLALAIGAGACFFIGILRLGNASIRRRLLNRNQINT